MAVSVTLAQSRMFAFSPYVLTIAGATSGQVFDFEFNGFTLRRYASTTGTLTLPLSKILKSAWATEEVGDLALATAGTANAASKLVKSFNIVIKSGETTIDTKSVTAIWGALQITESEPTTETIYRFGSRPLCVTQNIGNYIWDNDGSDFGNCNGKDFFIPNDNRVTQLQFQTTPSTVHKTINIVDISSCSDNEYIMWIDKSGQYRFFEFIRVESYKDVKAGDIFTKELLTMNSTTNGLYKSQSNVIDLSGNEIVMLGYPSATYEIQKFLQSLSTALKVYRFVANDTKWVEVTAKFNAIKIDERWKQNQSIEFEIVMPNLYTQSL